ncbi:prepilin-type N-terminal cleavage/methylation domain-containing protein [Phycisphaeraceae bacterium D3-23]
MRQTTTRRNAFTLIELLVVISIIALLIGILLPALGAARKSARASVCLGHLRGAGQGVATYATDNKDFYPGPNTSGARLNDNTVDAGDSYGADKPMQNFDWISPAVGEALGAPEDRLQRMAYLFNDEFRCPENDRTYDGDFGGGIPGFDSSVLYSNSYSTITSFHVYNTGEAPANQPDAIEYKNSRAVVDLQGTGRPFTIDYVGNASGKVFALDGSRFVDGNGEITFNTFARGIDGHNYGTYGPGNADFTGSPFNNSGALTDIGREFGFRHNGSTNTTFFDGHGENLSFKASLDTDYYYPTGSIVTDAAATSDPDDSNGDRVQ